MALDRWTQAPRPHPADGDRLGRVAAGSRLADEAIHDALQLPGGAPPYTTDQAAAALLVPAGVEVGDP